MRYFKWLEKKQIFPILLPCLCMSFPAASEPQDLMEYSTMTPAEFNQAEELEIDILPKDENITPEFTGIPWYDSAHYYVAEKVHDFSSYMDEGLAKDEGDEDIENRSYLRLRTPVAYSHRGYYDSDFKIKLRVDMPHVKKNWKIILETDPDDYSALENKQRDLPTTSSSGHSEGAIGGVRLQEAQIVNWKTNFDVGVLIKLPVDMFVRTDLYRVDDLNEDWTARFKQRFFYYHSVGSGSVSELDFYHGFDDKNKTIFKTGASAQYLYEDDKWELVYQSKFYHRINDKHLMEYAAGLSTEPNHKDEISNYWVSASWRQKIYKSWLYLYVTPQVDAPREFDYRLNPGIAIEFEAMFSKHREVDRLNRSIPKSTRRID